VPLNLEGSASTINQETIKLIKKKNISRVSIGVQSFNPELRRKLRIRSTLEEVLKLIPTLKKEGITIYIDLMYGFPNMGLGDYKKIVIEDVKKAIKLGVDGLDFSQYFPFYNPLGETIKKEKLKFPSAKKIIDIIKTGTKLLEEAGYIHVTEYGFCKKGEIMLEKTYFGDEQFMNGSYFEDEVPAYILMKKLTKTEIERAPIVAFPKLLRLNKKVFTPSLHKEYKKRFDKLKKEKLIIETPEYYELTAKGKYFINNIYLMLMESKEIERIKKQIKILALK